MTQNARYPFPGMNPYLEHPDLWPDVHNRLITMMANALTAQVRPYYYVAIEERVYLAGPKSNLVGRADLAVVEPTDLKSGWTFCSARPIWLRLIYCAAACLCP